MILHQERTETESTMEDVNDATTTSHKEATGGQEKEGLVAVASDSSPQNEDDDDDVKVEEEKKAQDGEPTVAVVPTNQENASPTADEMASSVVDNDGADKEDDKTETNKPQSSSEEETKSADAVTDAAPIASNTNKEVTFTTTNTTSTIPIDKGNNHKRLEFPKRKLYGREQELDEIQFAYQKLSATEQNHSQVVWVSGFSGCGKTALVDEAIRRMDAASNRTSMTKSSAKPSSAPAFYLIRGRHEPQRTSLPYKGISDALAHWYGKTLTSRERKKLQHIVPRKLEQEIGLEGCQSLANVLPWSLRHLILGKQKEGQREQAADDNNYKSDDDDRSVQSGFLEVDKTQQPKQRLVSTEVMSKSQLQFAVQSLLRVIGRRSEGIKIILYMDDCQWADKESLELMESFLSYKAGRQQQPPVPKLLFIGSYRANEVPPEHPLAILVQTLEDDEERPDEAMVKTITLSDLSKDDVQAFIADTLDQRAKGRRISTLVGAIYQRTMGNMFSTRQAMDTLVREGVLFHDTATGRWNWMLETEEELLTHLPEDMVHAKIVAQPAELQRALAVASFVRSTFDAETLCVLMNATMTTNNKNNRMTVDTLLPLLEHAVADGLLTNNNSNSSTLDDTSSYAGSEITGSSSTFSLRTGGGTQSEHSMTGHSLSIPSSDRSLGSQTILLKEFSFAHDRIRETSSQLISKDPEELAQFRLLLGNALVERAEDQFLGEQWMFFVGVHHLNLVPEHLLNGDGEKLCMAGLNLESAQLSMTKAAFETAAKAAEKGISLLPENCWEGYSNEVAYSLHSVAAEAHRLLGNIDSMENYCQTCLKKQENLPMEKKFDVYYTFALGLMYGSDRFEEARVIFLDLLEHVGCPFPRTSSGSKKAALAEMISFLWNKSKLHIALRNVGFMTDPKRIKAMKIIGKLGSLSYLMGDKATVGLTVLRALSYTIKHGVCVYAPPLIAGVGAVVNGILNDPKLGEAYADSALFLLEKMGPTAKTSIPPTVWLSYILGKAWTNPPSECIEPMRRAFRVGLSTDQADHTAWCSLNCDFVCVFAGAPLESVNVNLESECKRFESSGLRVQFVIGTATRRMVMGLLAKGEVPLQVLTEAEESASYAPAFYHFLERIEKGYLGQYELCANHAIEHKDFARKRTRGIFNHTIDTVISALACLIMASETRQESCMVMLGENRKQDYKKEYKQLYGLLSVWLKAGKVTPVIRYGKLLLDAESASIKGRIASAQSNFEQAMQLALAAKHSQDVSLIAERWAMFALNCLVDENLARAKAEQSIAYSKKWGALGRTKMLESRFASLLA